MFKKILHEAFLGKLKRIISQLNGRTLKPHIYHLEPVKELFREYSLNRSGARILLLGDSVSERVSRHDIDKRTLCAMIVHHLNRYSISSFCVSSSGYHLGVFLAILQALKKTGRLPEMAVIALNLRSLSPQWYLNPLWRYDDAIELLENPERLSGYDQIEIKGIDQKMQAYLDTPVYYPLSSCTRIADFKNIIDHKPLTDLEARNRYRDIFKFHYMFPLTPDNPRVNDLKKLLDFSAKENLHLFLYITPINYEGGVRYVGEEFIRAVRTNQEMVTSIVRKCESDKLLFKDWSQLFGSNYFFSEHETTEHLNQMGRVELADIVSVSIRENYECMTIKKGC